MNDYRGKVICTEPGDFFGQVGRIKDENDYRSLNTKYSWVTFYGLKRPRIGLVANKYLVQVKTPVERALFE